MTEQTYKMKYNLEFGDFKKKDLEKCKGEFGACDALVLISLLYPEEGCLSSVVLGIDGKDGGGVMKTDDIWKAWITMTGSLADNEKLSEGKRDLCKSVMDFVREVINKES